jgi:hypothetical protein
MTENLLLRKSFIYNFSRNSVRRPGDSLGAKGRGRIAGFSAYINYLVYLSTFNKNKISIFSQ